MWRNQTNIRLNNLNGNRFNCLRKSPKYRKNRSRSRSVSSSNRRPKTGSPSSVWTSAELRRSKSLSSWSAIPLSRPSSTRTNDSAPSGSSTFTNTTGRPRPNRQSCLSRFSPANACVTKGGPLYSYLTSTGSPLLRTETEKHWSSTPHCLNGGLGTAHPVSMTTTSKRWAKIICTSDNGCTCRRATGSVSSSTPRSNSV